MNGYIAIADRWYSVGPIAWERQPDGSYIGHADLEPDRRP